MIELDSATFQTITLALLLVALALLIATMLGVARIKKQLGEQAVGGADEGGAAAEPQPSAETEEAAAPGVAAAGYAIDAREGVEPHPLEEAAREPAAAEANAAPAAAPAEEPQEQPFEREGRWWFRRGDELLVYDEGTGQWQPAATGAAGTAGTAERGEGAETATATVVPTGETGGHWKCPTCGAVNGSTGTTCRMCFTPRPE